MAIAGLEEDICTVDGKLKQWWCHCMVVQRASRNKNKAGVGKERVGSGCKLVLGRFLRCANSAKNQH